VAVFARYGAMRSGYGKLCRAMIKCGR